MQDQPLNEAPQRLHEIHERIAAACRRSGRTPGEVTLIGASKTVPPERLLPYLQAGLTDCGENYVQEATAKIQSLHSAAIPADTVRWHLIGALQSNKAKTVTGHFALIHSVDRLSLAQALDKAAGAAGTVQPILIQVNIGEEDTKAGCTLEELPALVQSCAALPNLQPTGLMCLPPYDEDPEATRPFFRKMRQARESLVKNGLAGDNWDLSMGMSDDFEVAIEEGATLVRIGTALFGARAIK